MYIEKEPYEFLDLSDVNDSERIEIISTLTPEEKAQIRDPTRNHRGENSSLKLIKTEKPSIVELSHQLIDAKLNTNENIVPGSLVDGFPPLPSISGKITTKGGQKTCKTILPHNEKRSAKSRKASKNNVNAPMSKPSIPNLTTTAIENSLSVIDSNGNFVKVQHLPKAEKTQYGHVVRNLMLPRLIAPLSLPFYAVVKPTTAKLTELTVVPLRAPVLPASAAVKSHVEQQAKVQANVKTCGASNLKLSRVNMAQHTQPVVHQPQPQQQQQQQPQQQQMQPPQQTQQQQPPSQPQQTATLQQTSQQQQAQQQSQQQQIVSTSNAISQQNNNYAHHGGSAQPVYNQLHSGNLYVPAQGVQPVAGPVYPTMIPGGIPPNVYVNNVTANVNLHGWAAHPVPTYIQGGPQQYMSGEVQPAIADQSNQVMQPMQQVPVVSSNPGRSARRGRGRNNNNNNRRDYVQRQQQESPAPHEILNAQSVDPQTMANAGFPQYAYQYTYPTYFGGPPQNHMVHPQAQQATGPPLYVASPISVYPGHQIYNYHPGLIYPSMMHPAEYQFDESSDDQRSNDGMMPQMWHHPIYPEEYHEMIGSDDINHNAPSLASSETPSMLSPNYQMYDPQIQQTLELQQQMGVMHIYDEQQMQPHPGHMQQIVDDGSDGSLQFRAGTIMQSMVPLEPPQAHHHIMQNQVIQIDSGLDQSGESEHSLHEQHTGNTSDVALDAGIPEQIVEQQSQQQLPPLQQQPPPPSTNYHKSHHQQSLQQHQHIQQYVPIPVQNTVTKENMRDINQNVPNTASQHNTTSRSHSKDPNNVQHYNTHTDESHQSHQQQNQIHQHQQQQHHTHTQQYHHQHQQYQHHRNTSQQQNPSVPANSNITVQNNDSSVQQQQSTVTPMVNKTMSWTNSHTKKSTASVAVTATPTSTHKPYNHHSKPSTSYNSSNNHHQTTQQPQVKNYGTMKTPSSPVATSQNSNTSNLMTTAPQPQVNVPLERKHSGPVGVEHKSSVSTTSIASTVVPQQFQQQLATDPIKTSVVQQQVKKTEVLNLAPPISTNSSTAGSSSSSQSWASLFVSANTTNFTTSLASSSVGPAPALPPPFSAKKPIAKVAPYEGITPATPPAPVVTPGALSYSAASAQNLPPPTLNNQVGTSKQKASMESLASSASRNNNVDEWSFKLADFLSKSKTDYSTVSLRPRGLTNPSNYCYINSILQALMGCAPFYNLIKSIPKQLVSMSTKVKTPTINAMLQFTSEFSSLPSGLRLNRPLKQTKGKDEIGGELHCDPAFEPTAIYKLWNDSREEHVEGRQEDAEEFLGYVLNKLNDEMLELIKLVAKPTVEQNGNEQTSENEEGAVWQMIRNNRNKGSVTRLTDFGRTPLSDIFRGEVRSRLQREGEHCTDLIAPFFTLQLYIEKAASVKEAFEIFAGLDILEGVTGSKSKQEVVAWQQMTLEKLPVVLILHLKWFDYKSDGCTKILKTVEFPVELKIDGKILASKKYSQKQRVYRLFAVVYHDGKEASKGHYITDVYHTGYSSWLRFDDSTVKPVSEHNVLRPRVPRVPYLLYYRRCDTMPNLPQTTNTTLHANANK